MVIVLRKLTKINMEQKGDCLFPEYKRQGLTSKRDSFCAVFCFYIFHDKNLRKRF